MIKRNLLRNVERKILIELAPEIFVYHLANVIGEKQKEELDEEEQKEEEEEKA